MKLDHSCSEGRIGNRQDLGPGLANRKSFSRGQYPLCEAAKFNSLLSLPTKYVFLKIKFENNHKIAAITYKEVILD